ncbi:carbohydrate binding domain-containing protein [Kitasatospora mediocidica]|uniref:carbohydrate binding domain-containing protein n=1 Tax=Kitasatospora mediocidica TaxID=58352 RepID=UPI0006908817
MPRALHRQAAPGRAKLLSLGCAALLATGTLTALAVNASAADGNLLADPGFESGLGPWSCSAGSGSVVSGSVVSGGAHSGSYALQGAVTASGTAQCSQSVAVQPNTTYALSAWVQGNYVYLGATGNGVTDPAIWSPGGTGWNALSGSFTTGPGTTSVTVYLHGWYGQGSYLADDVTLTGPGGTPTPPPVTTPPVTPPTTPPVTPPVTPPTTPPVTPRPRPRSPRRPPRP